MGYSGRYHAASLAAVFIALAIGILIGIGLADDVVSTASQELEDSLREERDTARDEAVDLQADVDREQQFSDGAYPALVTGRLSRQRVAVIEIGVVPDDGVDDTAEAAIEAVEQAGGDLASVSSIELPLDVDALVEAAGPRFASARRDPEALEQLGSAIGAGLVGGGPLIDRVKPELFAAFNGDLEDVTRTILIRNPIGEATPDESASATALERGIVEGAAGASRGAAGIERTTTDPTTLDFFADLSVTSVDHVDLPAGKVSLVYALTGAEGSFGVKDGASSFLPELFPRASSAR